GPGLTCETFKVPWPVSWPDTSHALNAVLADTTFRPALFGPPSAARLKTATWSPGVVDVDLALIATPEDTVTEMGAVMPPPVRCSSFGGCPAACAGVARTGASKPAGKRLAMPSRRRLDMSPCMESPPSGKKGTVPFPPFLPLRGRGG